MSGGGVGGGVHVIGALILTINNIAEVRSNEIQNIVTINIPKQENMSVKKKKKHTRSMALHRKKTIDSYTCCLIWYFMG